MGATKAAEAEIEITPEMVAVAKDALTSFSAEYSLLPEDAEALVRSLLLLFLKSRASSRGKAP